MKAKRFSEEQIIGVLKEAEAGAKTKDLCRRHGISDATFYNWKAKYAEMTVSASLKPATSPTDSGTAARRRRRASRRGSKRGAVRTTGQKTRPEEERGGQKTEIALHLSTADRFAEGAPSLVNTQSAGVVRTRLAPTVLTTRTICNGRRRRRREKRTNGSSQWRQQDLLGRGAMEDPQ
jgi:putative transposase